MYTASGSASDNLYCGDLVLASDDEPPLAAHLVTPRAFYGHHGIYVGKGRVIHYRGFANGLRRGPVEEVSLAQFARGRSVRVRFDAARFDRTEIVARARSRLGECSYRLLTNNCEHLCAWALQAESRSTQVEFLRAALNATWRDVFCVVRRGLARIAWITGNSVSTDIIVP
jgi:hypothetical protein